MALKITRKAPGVEGTIAADNTLTFKLPIGLTYHQFYLEHVFTAAGVPVALSAAVTEVRVVANGKNIWNVRGAELDKMNQFDSREASGGILTFDFDRYNLRTRGAEEFTSLGTGIKDDPTPMTTLHVEMDLTAGSGVNGGTVTGRMRQSESRPLGLFKQLRRFVDNYSGAGTFEKADFPRGDLINRMFFFESANDIDRLRIERDDFVVFDRSKELNGRIQSDGVRTPLADLYVYDTTEDGNGSDQLITEGVDDLRFFYEIDGVMVVTSIVEYIGSLEL